MDCKPKIKLREDFFFSRLGLMSLKLNYSGNISSKNAPIVRLIATRYRESSRLRNLHCELNRRKKLATERVAIIQQGSLNPGGKTRIVFEIEDRSNPANVIISLHSP